MAKFNVDKPYQAPDLTNIQQWINSDPQTLEKLKGKVVLIDFWTYSCINCQRTQPYLNAWHDKYNDDGLVILGLHAPEFAFEKVTKNVEEAVVAAKIKYPVGLDNDFSTWQAYDNKFWPAKYLIDKNGLVRYTHFGEGEYEETEATIQTLLKESGANISEKLTKESSSTKTSNGQTPETYLSYSRGERFANVDAFKKDETVRYSLKDSLSADEWSFGGDWKIGPESSISGDNAQLRINYSAREVYVVMSGPTGAKVGVSVQGVDNAGGADVSQQNQVTLDSARLYTVVSTDAFLKNKQLTLTFPAGVTVNAFTFGN